MSQGRGRNLLGPMHWIGDALSENTGSIIKFPSSPNEMTAVECPIHVYVILVLSIGKIGVYTGSSSLSFSKSVGMASLT